MKIKELHISNFRNLVSMVLKFNEPTSIISGMNGLGKSNALNGDCWFLTNTILTDKWGSGENDLDSIIPNGAVRGINPEVSIITDKGSKFTKAYVSDWSKDGTKVKGHHTEYFVNDKKYDNEGMFNEELFKVFGYTSKLKTKDVNELRLFIDPLYALQKLEAKPLRALLVDLGCSVTDEELYESGFEDLRPYGEKYLGKWDVMRKSLKDASKTLVKEIESLQSKLETVASTEEFNPAELEALRKMYEDLVAKKTALRTGTTNPDVLDLEKQIYAKQSSLTTKKDLYTKSLQESKALLLKQKEIETEKLRSATQSKLAPLRVEIMRLETEISQMNASIRSYEMAVSTQNCLMKQYVDLANSINDKKTNLAIKLEATRNSNYKGMITCPICGSEFPSSEADMENFNKHKEEETQVLIKEIADLEKDKSKYKDSYSEAKNLRDEATQRLDEAKANLSVCEDKKSALQSQELEITMATPVRSEALDDIEKQLLEIEQPLDLSVEYKEIQTLQNRVNDLKQMDNMKIQDAINEIDIQISDVNSKISEQYVKQSKWNEKLEYQSKLEANQKALNDNEALLARCNQLIHTMIHMINQKATEKTGLTFVMLEENLSNDGIKEVCYATVDGIPFKDVNTATKIKYGIKFIEKLKEILGHNDLPILADRMEGIDSIETIKNLTKEQLICTRVTDGKEITVC